MKSITTSMAYIGLAVQLFFTSCFNPSIDNLVNSYDYNKKEKQFVVSMQEEKGQQGLLKQAGNFLIENLDELLEKYIENQHVNNEEKAKYPVREAIKRVPILMYHEIGYPEESSFSNRYVVTPDNFRKQLEFLNKNDYVPISIDEYLKDDFSQIPEDKLPIILTFDDATKGQFRYLEDKKIDPESAVGIMDDFAKEHDDWRQRASFFIDFVDRDGFFQVPFAQEEKEKDKISYLQENGYEVYCHTMYHPSLERVSFKDLLNDIRTFKYLVGQMDIEKSNIIAVPYGAYPQIDKTWQFLDKNFDYYFAAYARTRDKRAKRVNSEHFDNKYIPRIEVPPNNLSKLESYINGF